MTDLGSAFGTGIFCAWDLGQIASHSYLQCPHLEGGFNTVIHMHWAALSLIEIIDVKGLRNAFHIVSTQQ